VRKRSEKHQRRRAQRKPSSDPRDSGGSRERSSRGRERPRREGRGANLVGRVQKNARGFAFLIPQDRTQRDAYVPPHEAQFLMNDDVVEYSVNRDGRRLSATIRKIVKRGHKELVGKVMINGRRAALETPEGEVMPLSRQHRTDDLIAGEWVIGEVEEYPSPDSHGLVQIVEHLGPKLVPRFDIKIAAAKFGLQTEFDPDAIRDAEDARKWAEDEIRRPSPGRRDLRKLPFITIDGEDAKDFDDAILVVRGSGEVAFTLYVSIADVSFFVRRDTVLDDEALSRSTSVYFPGKAIPMLPEELSNDLCSLRPRQERLTLTAEIRFNREAHVIDAVFYESIIQTARRLTYNEVHEYYERKRTDLKDLDEPLKAALLLYKKLIVRRKERGVLDFDLPEAYIEVDDAGRPVDMKRTERFESHKLIEEFMIAANREVARHLKKGGMDALYRVHEEPDPRSKDEINALMRNLGVSKTIKDLSPRSLSTLLAATINMKNAKTLHQAILRLQKQARYEPEPKGHFGLALRDYTHFTSPIRRYPDLVVHRALKGLISREKRADKKYEENDYFTQVGIQTSDLERKAMEAERFVRRRKQCWYMLNHLDKEYRARISGVVESGLFLEIPELAVEGFLPIDALVGKYIYDETRMCLRKRPGHTTLALGDELDIRVAQVDVEQGQITFASKETA
jgi:ribonuclease R